MFNVEDAVRQEEDGTWTFECPKVAGQKCGTLEGPGFISSLWSDKQHAVDRGTEHLLEHFEQKPMSTLEEFRAARGLVPTADGGVTLDDLRGTFGRDPEPPAPAGDDTTPDTAE